VRITDRDRQVLGFAAEHRIVLAGQVQALIHTTAAATQTRLRTLAGEGLLRRHQVPESPGRCYSITRRGLQAIDSDLPLPRTDPRAFRHDVGLAWLWLLAGGGSFGPLQAMVSERRMRSVDTAEAHAARSSGETSEPFAVRLGGSAGGGAQRIHYSDLLLIGAHGSRVALELELTAKTRLRRERILAGYGADRRIDGVIYLVEARGVGRTIERSAARLCVEGRIRVQMLRWSGPAGARSGFRAPERVPARGPAR
jgi:hypothetical protein